MSDQLDEQHAQAGLQLLRDNPALGPNRVFDGKVPDPTPDPPYVVVYTTVSWPSGEAGIANALDHQSVTCRTDYNCHCVGLTAAAARAMAMQVRSSLLNAQPVIPGRNCGLIEQGDPIPPQRDETTGRLVMDAIAEYSFYSAPG